MSALPAPPQHTTPHPRPVALSGAEGQGRRPDLLDRVSLLVHRHAITALGVSLGMIYVWFGALKIAGVSPAAELVTGVMPWSVPGWFVPALGCFEVALGLWLASGRAMKWALPVFTAHMLGTFGVLVLMPHTAFQHGNPLELSMDGEFVMKNLILLCAGILVTTRRRPTAARPSRIR